MPTHIKMQVLQTLVKLSVPPFQIQPRVQDMYDKLLLFYCNDSDYNVALKAFLDKDGHILTKTSLNVSQIIVVCDVYDPSFNLFFIEIWCHSCSWRFQKSTLYSTFVIDSVID